MSTLSTLMNPRESTAGGSPQLEKLLARCSSVRPLGHGLPSIAAHEACLSRLVFDARFESWLASFLDLPGLAVVRGETAFNVVLSLATDLGDFEMGLDLAEWPALQMALALPGEGAACSVAAVLLEGLAETLRPELPGLRLQSLRMRQGQPGAAFIRVGKHSVSIVSCQPTLLDHLQDAWSGLGDCDLTALANLRLRARLRLMSRKLPLKLLRSLAEGDWLMLGNGSAEKTTQTDVKPTLIAGLGTTLQAAIRIHPQEKTVHIDNDPHLAGEDEQDDAEFGFDDAEFGDAGDDVSSSLENLQVPVAFELDTARLSLVEMASMRPGNVVELDVPLMQATVRLVCHGQTVGQGQLVAIGEQLGVRITRMRQIK